MRNKIVVGVWKDRLTLDQSRTWAEWLGNKTRGQTWPFIAGIAPAPIATTEVMQKLSGSPIQIVYQDVHWPAEAGSYIGTTSLAMLTELKIGVTMVGHSERRRFFGESHDDIRRKLLGCLKSDIYPILCIGDTETDEQVRKDVLREQLRNVIGCQLAPRIDVAKLAVAYEPIWAISTWRDERPLPTGKEATAMLDVVRLLIQEVSNQDPEDCAVLFGGSVNPANAFEYFSESSVDGALVGGASLTGESLLAVFEAGIKAWQK